MFKEKYLHVPYYILIDKKLDSTKKILLSAIISLCKLEKGCYASNEYFGRILSINDAGASKQINKLKQLGYIETKRFHIQSKERRQIKIINKHKNHDPKKTKIFINIPYSILNDNNLDSTQKLILSEILALSILPEGCIKSNSQFGILIGISSSAISKQITKLNKMNYVLTLDIESGNGISYRKIQMGSSYLTSEVVPLELEGTSQKTRVVVPNELEGTSYRNTINTTISSLDSFHNVFQNTSTENVIEIDEIEQKIINSCERGLKLLEQAKRNCIDNYWHFGSSNQEVEYLKQIVNEYLDAKQNI